MEISREVGIDDGSERAILLTKEEIAQIIQDLAQKIARDFKGSKLWLKVMLKGAFMFAADLSRALEETGQFTDIRLDFSSSASYGNSTVSSGDPKISLGDLQIPPDFKILLVEDIIDTCETMKKFVRMLLEQGIHPNALISLLSRNLVNRVDGFERPVYIGASLGSDAFIYGFGLDKESKGRAKPNIGYDVLANTSDEEIEIMRKMITILVGQNFMKPLSYAA